MKMSVIFMGWIYGCGREMSDSLGVIADSGTAEKDKR